MPNIMEGTQYFIDGFGLLIKPGIKRFVILPIIINFLIFVGLFLVSKHFFSEISHWVEKILPHWLQWLTYILWLGFFIGFFLVMLYTFVTLTNLIAAPFYSLLSEKIEWHLTGTILPSRSVGQLLKDTPRMIGRQLKILGYYLSRALIILVLFFVPVVHVIIALIWFLFNAWMMSVQSIDYPMDNHQISFAELKSKLRQKNVLSWGFGVSVMLLMMLPIVNVFVMPAAVAGATKMWVEKFQNS